MGGSNAIDCNNLKEVVGDADYVFVGNVVEKRETIYKFPVMIEDGNGNEREETSPYTNYVVQVVENIKGNLRKEDTILLQKAGGITKDGSMYIVYEKDEMPIAGNSYIFFAYAQPDGTLLVSGPASNLALDLTEAASDDGQENVYQNVIDAFEDQIVSERERFISVYESIE